MLMGAPSFLRKPPAVFDTVKVVFHGWRDAGYDTCGSFESGVPKDASR